MTTLSPSRSSIRPSNTTMRALIKHHAGQIAYR